MSKNHLRQPDVWCDMRDGESSTIADCLSLSSDSLGRSQSIISWLKQIDESDLPVATDFLMRLRMITRDHFSRWAKKAVESVGQGVSALYAVRKIDGIGGFWDGQDSPIARPAQSLGSEDLVCSLISQFCRSKQPQWLDHPSVGILKSSKVRRIIFIDDSIGSGERVSSFARNFFSNKSIRSLWSMGFIDVYIVSIYRSSFAESRIVEAFPGSDHRGRKRPRCSKIHFLSDWIYGGNIQCHRWGRDSSRFTDLCTKYGKFGKIIRGFWLGFGQSYSPYLFEHGAPDNIPGILFCRSKKWSPLFPDRTVTVDLVSAFSGTAMSSPAPSMLSLGPITSQIYGLLVAIKAGIRSVSSLAGRLNCHRDYALVIISKSAQAGFLTEERRLTRGGLDFLHAIGRQGHAESRPLKFDLYVPRSWSTDQATVQPPESSPLGTSTMAHSERRKSSDGESGRDSLERTDARVAKATQAVEPHEPTKTGVSLDGLGPSD